MKKSFAFAAVALLAIGATPVAASPGSDNNAVNAADPTSGLVCIVRGSETDPYRYDTACSYHRVDKFNKDGTLAWFRYQDKGTLQPGNEVPETGGQWDITQNWGSAICTGKEVVSPSGQYSSDLLCKFD